MKRTTLICFLYLLLVSCSKSSSKMETALNDAGKNRKELEKVLAFYSKKPQDSLKYKAAVFLIENLPYRYSCKSIPGYEKRFDSISTYPQRDNRYALVQKIFKKIPEDTTFDTSTLTPDISQITSQFLINNIELSFTAWNKIPKDKRASFEDFCNYILPYKTANEPFESDVRQKLYKKYSWIRENLEAGVPLQKVVDSVASNFHFDIMPAISKYYPQTFSISQAEKARIGLCPSGVNYLVNAFRSVGIVSAADITPHWGNHPKLGHTWLYVKYGNEEYSTDVRGRIDLKKLYKEESVPKIYRESYLFDDKYPVHTLARDVTNDYIATTAITIPNVLQAPPNQPALCVFDINKEWSPIDSGNYKNNNFTFNNIGVNVLYMATSQENNQIFPANYPFFIDKNKKTHFFKPSKSKVNSVVLTRKYKLSSARHRKKLQELMGSLNGAIFQGANKSDFSDAETLYQITKVKSNHLQKVLLKSNKKFKYVYFYSNTKKTSLATLAFYGTDGQKLNGNVICTNINDFNLHWSALDENPLSLTGGTDFKLGFGFSKPITIASIEFQIQNDMNHIVVGSEYELFYWDKDWKTLGVQIAKDTLLKYDNAPANALFWLKNHTEGKEEHVFIIDKKNRQYWLGCDN